jgi:hypothetical protein
MLYTAYYLDPINVFLYTWQLLPTLEIEEINTTLTKMYRWYRKISIWIVPASFISIFAGTVISFGLYFKYYNDDNTEEASYWSNLYYAFSSTLGYSTTVVNIISCTILFLTIRHAYKLTKHVAEFHQSVKKELKLNMFVTASHVTIILGTTISAFLGDNVILKYSVATFRVSSSLLCFTAL